MSSIFGQQAKPATPSLFTGASNTTPQKSLFGASTTQPQQSSGLFGSQPAQPQSTGLFGASTSQPAAGNSIFGAATTQAQQPASTGLFSIPQKTQSTGLFGSQSAATQSTGLFGASTTQPAASTSIFGQSQPQPAQSTGLFGAPAQPAQSTGLFGTAQNQSTGLFGAKPAQPSTGLFGSSQAQQPQPANNFAGSLSNGLGASTNTGALTAQTQRDLAQSRLQAAGLSGSVREKTVPQQLATLVAKWEPTSSETLLQTYLYNAANPTFAPFYHPQPGESEREYEAALAKKPEPVDGNTWVPVLVRGFKALGERVEYQAKFVQSMQVRLHEMNNALIAINAKHAQELSVRIDASKRQHTAISQRTMRVMVKLQILRNRGYALDTSEEVLRTQLLDLQKTVQDPAFAARSQSVWARMVVLRERTKWLAEESKKLGASANGQSTGSDEIPPAIAARAKQILNDYGLQIQQLNKEMSELQAEIKEWEDGK